jgi:hypothetical protein
MENKQLEFKGKGFKAARASFSGDAALQGLLDIARSHIPAAAVHVDATDNRELWHRSRIRWESDSLKGRGPKSLEVYYHSFEVLLPVLAHEVGHLETIPELGGIEYYSAGGSCQYRCEYFASRWALGYLRAAGMGLKELRAAQAQLQSCLDNYQARLEVSQRAVLDFKDSPAMKAGERKGC